MTEASKIAKKYKLLRIILDLILSAILLVTVIFFYRPIVIIPALFAYLVLVAFINNTLYYQLIDSILSVEFNLKKYAAVWEEGNFKSRHCLELIFQAYYSGDFNSAANLCEYKLKDRRARRYTISYLTVLGRIYFAVDDKKNLGITIARFEEYISEKRNGQKLRDKHIIFKFFAMYLNGQYQQLKDCYAGCLTERNYIINKWTEVHTRFLYAVACYLAGDISQAEENFTATTVTAPELILSDHSYRYLDAIRSNTPYVPYDNNISIDGDFSLPYVEKYFRHLRIFKIVLASVVAVAILLTAVLMPIVNNFFADKRIEAAYARQDIQYDWHDEIYVYDEYDNYLCCLTLYSADNVFYVANVYLYEGEEEYYITPPSKISLDTFTDVQAYPNQQWIKFILTEEPDTELLTDALMCYTIEHGNEIYFLFIESIYYLNY